MNYQTGEGSISGRSTANFWNEFIKRIGPSLVNTTYVFPLAAYDAVWMASLALDKVEQSLRNNGIAITDRAVLNDVIKIALDLRYLKL